MKALIVIGIIGLVLFLLCLIRVGAEAIYDDEGFRLAVRFWFFRIKLGGKDKPAKNKKDKKRKDESADGESNGKRKSPSRSMLRSLAEHGYAMLCRFILHVRIDVLKLHFTSAFDDPAVTALAYGAAGAAMDALQRVGGSRISCSDMRADVDFDSSEPRYDFRIGARMSIGRLVGAAARFGFSVLMDSIRDKRKERTYGKSSDR